MTHLLEAASSLLTAIHSIGQRMEIERDEGDILFRFSKFKKIPAPGCIRDGYDQLKQAQNCLRKGSLPEDAVRIVDGSIEAIRQAMEDLKPLRVVAEEYDKTGDSSFSGFPHSLQPEYEFLGVKDAISQSFPYSSWHDPIRACKMVHLVAAIDSWLTKHGEDLKEESSNLTELATNTQAQIAKAVPSSEIDKELLRYMVKQGFDSTVNTIARGTFVDKLKLDDDATKNAITRLRLSNLVFPVGNTPRLKYYLSPLGLAIATYISDES